MACQGLKKVSRPGWLTCAQPSRNRPPTTQVPSRAAARSSPQQARGRPSAEAAPAVAAGVVVVLLLAIGRLLLLRSFALWGRPGVWTTANLDGIVGYPPSWGPMHRWVGSGVGSRRVGPA